MLNYGEVQVINIYHSWNQIKEATIAIFITIGINCHCHWTVMYHIHGYLTDVLCESLAQNSVPCNQLFKQHFKFKFQMDRCHSIFSLWIWNMFYSMQPPIWNNPATVCVSVLCFGFNNLIKISAYDWHVNTIFQRFELTWHELTTNTNCMWWWLSQRQSQHSSMRKIYKQLQIIFIYQLRRLVRER